MADSDDELHPASIADPKFIVTDEGKETSFIRNLGKRLGICNPEETVQQIDQQRLIVIRFECAQLFEVGHSRAVPPRSWEVSNEVVPSQITTNSIIQS